MRLYIMRHGPAETIRSGQSDADRMLTAEGANETREAARGLSRLGVAPKVLLTSPLVRARETASLVADELGLGAPVIEDDLAAGASAERIVSSLRKAQQDTLIVGHNPDFSELVSYLLVDGARLGIDFNTGGVVCLEFNDAPRRAAGVLKWYLRRKQLGAIGAS